MLEKREVNPVRMKKSHIHKKAKHDPVASKRLLAEIWGLDPDHRKSSSDAYIKHFLNLCRAGDLVVARLNVFTQYANVVELVQIVKGLADSPLKDTVAVIQSASHSWTSQPFDDLTALSALDLATRLWLFSEPPLGDLSLSLNDVNSDGFTLPRGTVATSAADVKLLSSDFSAKSLTRKGGFYLVWTSSLSEHLTFASKDQIRVFCHAQILRDYQLRDESRAFPDGFLEETYRTIHLLFPFEDIKVSKRVRRIGEKEEVDLEAAIGLENSMQEYAQRQLSNYPYYGSRLAEIQRRYNLARPHRLEQWWYDRRQRPEWAALMVALVVFILTVIFGIISSVTGIMQVYAAFKKQ